MKKKLFTSKIKTILIVAVALAIVTTVIVLINLLLFRINVIRNLQ